MGRTAWGGNCILFWLVGPYSVKLEPDFLLLAVPVSRLCCFTWDQTMVEVMKIMSASFKRRLACTASLSVPDPVAGHHWPVPLPETPGHSQVSLGQSLVGSLLLSPGSWCAQGFLWALRSSLASMGFDFSKHDFALHTIFLGLLLCSWMWGLFLVGSNILLSIVVQQWVVILEFSQKKMSSCPSTPPFKGRFKRIMYI